MTLGISILKACKTAGLPLSRACDQAGLNYSTLHSQIRNEREIPFTTIDRLCNALKLPLGYFSQFKPSISVEPSIAASSVQAEAARALSDLMARQMAAMADWGYEIGTDDVLDWLMTQNNRLVKHDWLLERVDLFYPATPGDLMLRPYRIGAKSLAARYFQLLDTDDYSQVVGRFDRNLLSDVIAAHVAVADQRYAISDLLIDQDIDGTRVKGSYRRLLAPVTTDSGEALTLVFSKLTQFSSG